MDTKTEILKMAKSLTAMRTQMESKIDSIIRKSAVLNERTGGYAVLKNAMISDLTAFYKTLDAPKQKEFLRVLEYITPWNYVGGISNSDSDKVADVAEKVIRTVTGNKNFRLSSVKVAKGLTAKNVKNLREMFVELHDLYMQAQNWEKRADEALRKTGEIDMVTFKRYEKLALYLEGAWVLMKTMLDQGKPLVSSSHVAGRWPDVKAMRKDLDAMLDQWDDWLDDEKTAVQDGTAAFDYTPYYSEARESLRKTIEKFTKVERYV